MATSRQTMAVATVAVVIDGETIALSGGGKVRLLQIDAPELGSGECFSRASYRALQEQVPVGSLIRPRWIQASTASTPTAGSFATCTLGRRTSTSALVRVGAAAPYFCRERGQGDLRDVAGARERGRRARDAVRLALRQRPEIGGGRRASLHAKCAVADGERLLVSSANLTEYAFTKNIELGLLVEGGDVPGRVQRHLEALITGGVLRPVRR